MAAVLAVTLALLLLADPITRVIGSHGANVLKRVMGMILAGWRSILSSTGSPIGCISPGGGLP